MIRSSRTNRRRPPYSNTHTAGRSCFNNCITIPPDIRLTLEAKVLAMAETAVRGDNLGVAQFYADNALLTDLKEFHVEGREAIDQYWTGLPTFSQWQLTVQETGGDASTPWRIFR